MSTSSNGFNIREVQPGDIPAVVAVHLASFQNFFLTFLGRPFLERLYLEIVEEPGGVFFVATSTDNSVIGFAAGVPHLSDFYRRLSKKRWLTFGLASANAAIRRPQIIPRLWRALNASKLASQSPCPATLMSIAVAPDAKGLGAGKLLIRQFLDRMARNGVPTICLTTDRDNNAATLGFYERLGFTRVREFRTPEGRWICEYVIETHQETMHSGNT